MPLILMLLFFSCMSEPRVNKYPANLSPLEIKLQYQYDKCLYAQQFNKIDLKCYEILNVNQKIGNLLNYDLLKKEKKLPVLYRPSGKDEMTFDDFFKYIK